MGEGRAMRLATRDFYAMGHDGDTSSIRTFGARGREIGAKSTRFHHLSLAPYDSVLGTTDRGSEKEAHGENGTPKHGQELTAITWVKYQKNTRPKNFRKMDPNGRVQINDRSFYQE